MTKSIRNGPMVKQLHLMDFLDYCLLGSQQFRKKSTRKKLSQKNSRNTSIPLNKLQPIKVQLLAYGMKRNLKRREKKYKN